MQASSLVHSYHTSVTGLDARTLSSTRVLLPDLLTTAKYLIAYRADTVLPAPDSPLTMIDWFLWFLRIIGDEHCYKSVNSTLRDHYSFFLPGHLFVSLLCHCKYMRVHVSHVLAWVGMNDCISIDMKLFVWIYSHQYDTWKWGNSTRWAKITTCTSLLGYSLTAKDLFQPYRSRCRWFWTPQIALWDCAGLQVHAGSWERWGRSPRPRCPGCEEEGVEVLMGQQGSRAPVQRQVM